ncbi:MAG: hypothetical protein J7647_28280 [Cyanobacteria bacterium SBLK]|nr:hypothetical protein [Cyanobacteria bacterium SBLK]
MSSDRHQLNLAIVITLRSRLRSIATHSDRLNPWIEKASNIHHRQQFQAKSNQ